MRRPINRANLIAPVHALKRFVHSFARADLIVAGVMSSTLLPYRPPCCRFVLVPNSNVYEAPARSEKISGILSWGDSRSRRGGSVDEQGDVIGRLLGPIRRFVCPDSCEAGISGRRCLPRSREWRPWRRPASHGLP